MPNVVPLALERMGIGFVAPRHPPGPTGGLTTAQLLGENYEDLVEQAIGFLETNRLQFLDIEELSKGVEGIWRASMSELVVFFGQFREVGAWESDHWLQIARIGGGGDECVVYPDDRTDPVRIIALVGEPSGELTALRRADVAGSSSLVLSDECDTATRMEAQSGRCAQRRCRTGRCDPQSIVDGGTLSVVGCQCR